MPIKADPLVADDLREQIAHALSPEVGGGIGTIGVETALDSSDGVEFEIGGAGGIYVGTIPYSGETPIDLPYSDEPQPAEGVFYVYIADLDAKKRETGGERTATYAALRYESELFRTLSRELRSIVSDVFSVDTADLRFERYGESRTSGAYFVLPIKPRWE